MKNICPKTDRNFIFSEVEVELSENKDGMLDSWSVVPKQKVDIPYIPASLFDTDSVLKNGNADLLMKHPFSVGSDLSSIDRAEEYISKGVSDVNSNFVKEVVTNKE